MILNRNRAVLGCVLLIAALLAACGGGAQSTSVEAARPEVQSATVASTAVSAITGPNITAIQQRGKLMVGTKHDVPKFGFLDKSTSVVDGYEIDLVRQVAKAIFGDESKFETIHVTPNTRVELLNSGAIDLVAATFTVTEERRKLVDFSPVYYTDGVGLLVAADSGIQGLKDLNGKAVGFVSKSTAVKGLQNKAQEIGLDIRVVEFASYANVKAALKAGEITAMSADGAILAGYSEEKFVLLPDRYTKEPYAFAARKGSDDLQKLLDQVLADLERSGELQRLQQKWGIGTN